MNLTVSQFKDRLLLAIESAEKLGIHREDLILVGSGALAFEGIKPKPGDIDFAISPANYNKLLKKNKFLEVIQKTGTINLSSDAQILRNRYRHLNISDKLLFENTSKYTKVVMGVRTARVELELAKKVVRVKDKDIYDVSRILQFSKSAEWDWTIVRPTRIYTPKNILLSFIKGLLRDPRALLKWIRIQIFKRLIKGLTNQLSAADLATRKLDTGIVIQNQTVKGYLVRYDILVRKIACDVMLDTDVEYRESMDVIPNEIDMYEKMQSMRGGGERTTNRFLKLISSIKQSGFQQARYPIFLNHSGNLIDGSHRIACALSTKQNSIPVLFHPITRRKPSPYSRDWFISRKFDNNFLKRLDDEEVKVLINSGAAFCMILWNPAMKYTDQVVERLQKKNRILKVDKSLNIIDIEGFCRELYAKDGIAKWKVYMKNDGLTKYPQSISLIWFMVDQPKYRLKRACDTQLSSTTATIKREIRDAIAKQLDSGRRDLICHIGDNPEMNREILQSISTWAE